MFFWDSSFFDDPTDVGNLISGSSAFSKTSLNIWTFMVHVLWSLAWRILSIALLVCLDEYNWAVVWTSFGITFLLVRNGNWSFFDLWRLVGFDYRTYTGLGNRTLGGQKQNLVCTRTQETGAVTRQETDPGLPVSVQESLAEAWVGGGLVQGRVTECNSACTGPSEGGRRFLHYLHYSLVQVKKRGENTDPLIYRKL